MILPPPSPFVKDPTAVAPPPPDLAARRLRRLTDERAQIAPGYGFREASLEEVRSATSLTDHFFQVWEPPRQHQQYILGADVSDGLGQNRSVVDVLRMPTMQEPAEQVAQFVSDRVMPSELSYILDAIGHLYCNDDGFEAMVAIEINNHGLATQDTLQLHLGYRHFYRWEVLNAADPGRRFTSGLGWRTTVATRPILLSYFYDAVMTVDPVLQQPDLIINSPYTLQDMRDFQTEGALWEAAAARGAQDDCVMALAIAFYVGYRMQAGEQEPLADRRRRHHAIASRKQRLAVEGADPPDFRNLPYTADEVKQYARDPDQSAAEELEVLLDARGVIFDQPEEW